MVSVGLKIQKTTETQRTQRDKRDIDNRKVMDIPGFFAKETF